MKVSVFLAVVTICPILLSIASERRMSAVEIGELLATETREDPAKLFIFASIDAPRTTLTRDLVMDLHRVVEQCPGFGFSLDLIRRGSKAFTKQDIPNALPLLREIGENPSKLCQYLRTVLPQGLREKVTTKRAISEKQSASIIVDALNALTNQTELWNSAAFSDVKLEPDTAKKLASVDKSQNLATLNRFLLEDAFPQWIVRDIEPRYAIRYYPEQCSESVTKILTSTATERILMASDNMLKRFAYGIGLPETVSLGPTESFLCANAIESHLRSGGKINDLFPRPTRYYFDMSINRVSFPRDLGDGAWFDESQLYVRSGTDDPSDAGPRCIQDFAHSLSKNLPALMAAKGDIADTFRKLRTVLLLNWVISLGIYQDIGMNSRINSCFETTRSINRAPKLEDLPMFFVHNGEVVNHGISGGILFPALFGTSSLGSQSVVGNEKKKSDGCSDPMFLVDEVELQGRRVLRIDLSEVVGLVH
jgi:hypothetical protein